MKPRNISLALLAALPSAVHAEDGWPRLNIHESITVEATPARAFEVVSRWDALQSWCPAFVSTEIRSGGTAVASRPAATGQSAPPVAENEDMKKLADAIVKRVGPERLPPNAQLRMELTAERSIRFTEAPGGAEDGVALRHGPTRAACHRR